MNLTLALSRTTRGHRSWYLAGSRNVHRSGGSTTWSSTEMTRGTSICMSLPRSLPSTLSGPAGTLPAVTIRVDGKVVVVVGGETGVGQQIADGLRDRGATVAVTGSIASRADADSAIAE